MTDISLVADALTNLGFTEHQAHPAARPSRVKALSHNGPYKVLGAWEKGNVRVHVEQNTAPNTIRDTEGTEYTAQAYQFPPVMVIETVDDAGESFDPPRTMAVSYGDLEALAVLAVPQDV